MTADNVSKLIEIAKDSPDLNVFALVDGLQYERCFGEEITYISGMTMPLFRAFPDSQISFAGPWLIDLSKIPDFMGKIKTLERQYPSVSWLTTANSLDELVLHFDQFINVKMPDGKVALLRFYDPRVLYRIMHNFSPKQLTALMDGIQDWFFLLDGLSYSLRDA